ncbi:hypothetical protein MP228_000209 [Amoeboaphelidium protococcarum]|nr:hypothetical protein MP228_000209 [Amoeboaphelidium protococcarum]
MSNNGNQNSALNELDDMLNKLQKMSSKYNTLTPSPESPETNNIIGMYGNMTSPPLPQSNAAVSNGPGNNKSTNMPNGGNKVHQQQNKNQQQQQSPPPVSLNKPNKSQPNISTPNYVVNGGGLPSFAGVQPLKRPPPQTVRNFEPEQDSSATIMFDVAPVPPPPIQRAQNLSVDSLNSQSQRHQQQQQFSQPRQQYSRSENGDVQYIQPKSKSTQQLKYDSDGADPRQMLYQKMTNNLKSSKSKEMFADQQADQYYDKPPQLQPKPLKGMIKSQSQPSINSVNSQSSLEGPEEVDLSNGPGTDDDLEEERQLKEQSKRMSVALKFEEVSLSDFQNLDSLLGDLDQIFDHKKGRKIGQSKLQQEVPKSSETEYLEADYISDQPSSDQLQRATSFNRMNASSKMPLKPQLSAPGNYESPAEERLVYQPYKSRENLNQQSHEDKVKNAMMKLTKANVKKITARIYIENAQTFKTLVITSLQSAKHIVRDLKERSLLEDTSEWTLFEIINEYGLERPLRDFEIVTDVMTTWGKESPNSLLLKKYRYKDSLTAKGAKKSYPKMCGWAYVELKKDKWQKRYLELKNDGLYYSKDSKGGEETLLCHLDVYDVYTLMRVKKKAPTKFCFAMKSQENAAVYENPFQYCYYLCVDSLDKMKDWVLSIRSAKSRKLYLESADSSQQQQQQQTPSQSARSSSSSHNVNPYVSSFNDHQQHSNMIKKAVSSSALNDYGNVALQQQPGQMSLRQQMTGHVPQQKLSPQLQQQPLKYQTQQQFQQRPVYGGQQQQMYAQQLAQQQQQQQQQYSSPQSGSYNAKNTDMYDVGPYKPVVDNPALAFQKPAVFPQHSVPQIPVKPMVGAKPEQASLVEIIGYKQKDPIDNSQTPVNLNAFHQKNSQIHQPLVPLTKRELEKIPGVKISKYDVKKETKRVENKSKCQYCNCTAFARNPFKEYSCANCFHVHDA